jgi:hypothetical protein
MQLDSERFVSGFRRDEQDLSQTLYTDDDELDSTCFYVASQDPVNEQQSSSYEITYQNPEPESEPRFSHSSKNLGVLQSHLVSTAAASTYHQTSAAQHGGLGFPTSGQNGHHDTRLAHLKQQQQSSLPSQHSTPPESNSDISTTFSNAQVYHSEKGNFDVEREDGYFNPSDVWQQSGDANIFSHTQRNQSRPFHAPSSNHFNPHESSHGLQDKQISASHPTSYSSPSSSSFPSTSLGPNHVEIPHIFSSSFSSASLGPSHVEIPHTTDDWLVGNYASDNNPSSSELSSNLFFAIVPSLFRYRTFCGFLIYSNFRLNVFMMTICRKFWAFLFY